MTDEQLKMLHKKETEILDKIHEVCQENGLKYYLAGGSLLGAVRHKGFIPWDDDLDVAMPRADYEKFKKIMISSNDPDFYLHSIDTDKKYWLPFSKLRLNNTMFVEENSAHIDSHKGIYVDIFPLDDVKYENSYFQRARAKVIKLLELILIKKSKIKYNRFKYKVLNFCTCMFSNKTVYKLMERLMKSSNGKNYNYYTNYGSYYGAIKQTVEKSVYGDGILLEFNEKKFYAPNNWDYLLTRIYGDYMKLPPVEQRVQIHQPLSLSFGEDYKK